MRHDCKGTLYTSGLLGRLGCVAVATRGLAFVAAVLLGHAWSPAQAQLSCNPSAPRTDPGTGFVPFATLERLEVRSGRLGAADWEWGLGVNTQSAGQFATANLDWVNERVYDWTLSYSGTGSATIEVRDGAALLFTRTWASGMDSGNALKLYVKSSSGIAAGNLVSATSATINGQPAAGSLQTAGTGAFSEQSLYWFYPAMSQGFTATGTVKLTFIGSYPPTGSRLNFIVTAGNLPCAPEPTQAKLYYIHTDHLNTPRLIADEQQRTVWRWDNTDPFGGNPPDENPSGLGVFEFPLRLPGQYFDKETNLHYNYFRDYVPDSGRYVQSDPIGLGGGLNTYAYVAGMPLSYVDPTGELFFVPIVLASVFSSSATAAGGTIAAVAALGAAVGAVSGAVQTGQSLGWCWDNAPRIAASALAGGAIGYLTGLATVSLGLGGGAIVGGASGFMNSIAGSVIAGQPVDVKALQAAGLQATIGVFSGFAAVPALGPLVVANPAVASALLSGGAQIGMNAVVSTASGGFGFAKIVK